MLKKLTALFLTLLITVSLCSCNGKGLEDAPQNSTTQPSDMQNIINTDIKFKESNTDITESLENLGINNGRIYSADDIEELIARNPYDMITVGNNVMVSGGNYNENKGPVRINAYTLSSKVGVTIGALKTEQVNEFYSYGNFTFALGIDPQKWQSGEIYYTESDSGKWITVQDAFRDNIHCYDMVKFHGNYYFCGSNVNYITVEGKEVEASKPAAFRLEGDFTTETESGDFIELPLKGKNEKIITYRDDITVSNINGQTYVYCSTVPRLYQFFVFNDTLFAYHFGSGCENNGFFVLDEEQGCFVYSEQYNPVFLNRMYEASTQDKEKIEHDFAWNDKYYFIINGLYSTADFKKYEKAVISGYEDYTVHDVIFRNDYALCLAGKQVDENTFVNVVLKTDDFVNYTPLFNFKTPLFARSFELCEGAFYFGLGFYSEYKRNASGKITDYTKYDVPKNVDKCGTILRYKY